MLIGAIILAPIIFVTQFGAQIITMVQSGSGLQENYAGQVTSEYVDGLLRGLSTYSASKVAGVFIIWATVGVLAYVGLLALVRAVIAVRNEVVVDTKYRKGSPAKLLALHFAQKFLVGISFIAFLAVSILYLLPYWMDMLRIFVFETSWANGGFLIGGLLGLTLNIYVLWSFAYLTWIYEESV